MMETYCGKTCAACSEKEALLCSGCKTGAEGECKLADCCREKGHESCDTCGFHEGCATLHECEPAYKKQSIEEQQRQKEELTRFAPLLASRFWLLFWLMFPAVIASILTNKRILPNSPGLYMAGAVLNIVCLAVMGLIFWKLSPVRGGYRNAGICFLVVAGADLLVTLLFWETSHASSMLITIPAAIVNYTGKYYEFNANSGVLIGVNKELSESWITLWKWYLGSMLAVLGSLFFMILIPTLGLVLLVCTVVVSLLVEIAEPVLLYRSAKALRAYAASEPALES